MLLSHNIGNSDDVADAYLAVTVHVALETAAALNGNLRSGHLRVLIAGLRGVDADDVLVGKNNLLVVILIGIRSLYLRNVFHILSRTAKHNLTIYIADGGCRTLLRLRSRAVQRHNVLEVLPRCSSLIGVN